MWWKESVIYQIYPRSFNDSNKDGIGDIRGIILKLDYLKDLGIDIIWLSPIFESPNDDNGYDISDYKAISKEFGTMEDFDELLRLAHSKGLKIVLDMVVNHTSDEHPWFVESKSSKDNPKRDYYIWKEPKRATNTDTNEVQLSEPNNWGSFFSPSAWEYDKSTQEYYLHFFSKKQPDLNWKNPNVRKDVYDIMKWWLDKGVDGFRLDVINFIAKNETYQDCQPQNDEKSKYVIDVELYCNQPHVHEYLKETHTEVYSKYDIVTIGECGCITIDRAKQYTGEERQELNMVFQFQIFDLGFGPNGKWDIMPWKLTDFKRIMTSWQKELYGNGWQGIVMSNHDSPRSVSRYGNDKEYWSQSAKMLATLMYTHCGTPFLYQGEEIGMSNVNFENINDYNDIEIKFFYDNAINKLGWSHEKTMASIHARGRDNARTPMQWDNSANAGFTSGNPWLKINPNYENINVSTQTDAADSIYNYYKKIIQLRKENKCLIYGEFKPILENNENIYAYIREYLDERFLVFLNFYETKTKFNLPQNIEFSKAELLISNYVVEHEAINELDVRPYEARVYKLVY